MTKVNKLQTQTLLSRMKYLRACEYMEIDPRNNPNYTPQEIEQIMGKAKKQWKLIGGYGEIGDTNWGYDRTRIETQKWLEKCKRHIGETVMLTGGGSLGKYWLAKLVDVSIGKLGEHEVPKVKLIDLDPPWNKYIEDKRPNEFEPWLGSWQISALVEI